MDIDSLEKLTEELDLLESNIFEISILDEGQTNHYGAASNVGWAIVIIHTSRRGYDFESFCSDTFNIEHTSMAYHWLFNFLWKEADNTPKGAAKRIRYFLKNGVPDDFTCAGVLRNENVSSRIKELYQNY